MLQRPPEELSSKMEIPEEEMDTSDTQWGWFYLAECGKWHMFQTDSNTQCSVSSEDIERSFKINPEGSVSFTTAKFNYKLDFPAMKQTNLTTGKQRPIKRAPFSISAFSYICENEAIPMPSHWENVNPEEPYQLIPLQKQTNEYNEVSSLFGKTMDSNRIKRIQRIQNLDLWEFFCSDWWDRIVLERWGDQQWTQNFRMKKDTFLELCEWLAPALRRRDTCMRPAIPLQKRVAIALWKLSTLDSYQSIGNQFSVGRSTIGAVLMQAVSDHWGQFTDINVGWSSKAHDARVFRNSSVCQRLHTGTFFPDRHISVRDMDMPICLVGDTAYPLQPCLMKPYMGHLNPSRQAFNAKLTRGLKARLRCLLTRLDLAEHNIPPAVAVCCMLHNVFDRKGEAFLPAWMAEADWMAGQYMQPCTAAVQEAKWGPSRSGKPCGRPSRWRRTELSLHAPLGPSCTLTLPPP
ncbi:protein mono-ADP-ribosyltransferase PARP11 isoform X2 [Pelodiscus sinensis]